MTEPPEDLVQRNPWADLRRYTGARIALGRVGSSLPTEEVLRFGLAHAAARDAVHAAVDWTAVEADLAAGGLESRRVHSLCPDRHAYLLRPDLGRRLDAATAGALDGAGCDLAIVIADGLSASAVQRHAAPLVLALLPLLDPGWRVAPVVLVGQGRVAVGDDIGARLRARLVAVLIGERPGLSSPDSLGAYLTWEPRPGRIDAERNCISNIRPEGLAIGAAARRLAWLLRAALQSGLTGIGLKDESALAAIEPTAGDPG